MNKTPKLAYNVIFNCLSKFILIITTIFLNFQFYFVLINGLNIYFNKNLNIYLNNSRVDKKEIDSMNILSLVYISINLSVYIIFKCIKYVSNNETICHIFTTLFIFYKLIGTIILFISLTCFKLDINKLLGINLETLFFIFLITNSSIFKIFLNDYIYNHQQHLVTYLHVGEILSHVCSISYFLFSYYISMLILNTIYIVLFTIIEFVYLYMLYIICINNNNIFIYTIEKIKEVDVNGKFSTNSLNIDSTKFSNLSDIDKIKYIDDDSDIYEMENDEMEITETNYTLNDKPAGYKNCFNFYNICILLYFITNIMYIYFLKNNHYFDPIVKYYSNTNIKYNDCFCNTDSAIFKYDYFNIELSFTNNTLDLYMDKLFFSKSVYDYKLKTNYYPKYILKFIYLPFTLTFSISGIFIILIIKIINKKYSINRYIIILFIFINIICLCLLGIKTYSVYCRLYLFLFALLFGFLLGLNQSITITVLSNNWLFLIQYLAFGIGIIIPAIPTIPTMIRICQNL